MKQEQQHNKLVFYRDKLAMSAKILRDDAQLGLLFRNIIMTIETGEQAEFSEDQYIIETLYADFIEKLAYNDERWQAATHAKRLGGIVGRAKRDGWDWWQFAEKAESEGYSPEEYEKYQQEFTKEPEPEAAPDRYEVDSEEMEAAKEWFRKLYRMFPKGRQNENNFDSEKVLELYRNYRYDMQNAIELMLEEKGDCPFGAKRFFDTEYLDYIERSRMHGYQ